MSKRAVILAGGTGTRLRPYTVVLPKPLMPVGDYPILEVIVRQLAGQGFARITLAVNHQADIMKAFFGDGSKWGVNIDYSLETKPLSTVAPVRLISDLPDNFLLMNGDVLTDLDLGNFLQRHVTERRLFTIAAARRLQLIDYGVLQIDLSNALTGFREKPQLEYLVSMGVYAVNRTVLDFVPTDTKYGFDDLMNSLLKMAKPVMVEPFDGYWLDIG
ncbi:MAG: NTP transferase domain-containing protein, partial [Deltaproteobacteria bacterium]|nr:NTP transferase domain-containing protein [Deltaproteobacteria bacterium]